MRAPRLILLVWLFLIAGASLLGASALDRADAMFAEGFFPEAESVYTDALQKNPGDTKINTLLGMIELFSNRLDESEKYLRRAAQNGPFQNVAQNLLGEVFYRRDKFPEAAQWFRAGGSAERAGPLETFGDAAPYTINGSAGETRLEFVTTDPLPIVRVRVNGGEAASFLIDTGGAEVQVDSEFARRLNLISAGGGSATLLDGSQTEMRHSRVATLRLGEFEVRNVPVGIRPLPVFAGRKLDGVLGTVLLYHFLATLDYPHGEMILRRRSPEVLHSFETRAQLEKQVVMPFWLASDHMIVARGRVNHTLPMLLLVATGVTTGFTCPESTIEQAALSFDRNRSLVPATEPGTKLAAFVVNELYLGEARQQNVSGIAGAFPAGLEQAYGFRIGGLIGHQFFRAYTVTFDFSGMRLFLGGVSPKQLNKRSTDVETALLPQ
jgi:Aspartyl protease/Tetratricopeptide repeat